MSSARDNILARLRERARIDAQTPRPYLPEFGWDREQKIERLTERMRAVRTEVHRLADGDWINWLNRELPRREIKNVLIGTNNECERFKQLFNPALQVECYEQDIEAWKPRLFHDIDASITTTRGGIAETGSLILWPDADEPRLMSLVPPLHIALLQADSIYETFAQAMHLQRWADGMPTNALLISGPSKTADIEQTLAYGIHGPRRLMVLILG